MLTYTDLKKGTLFVLDGEPYQVLDSSFSRMQQRKAVVQAKVKNLRTGKIVERSFQPSDQFEEADITKKKLMFIYARRGEYFFADPKDRSRRFSLKEGSLGDAKQWLKANTELTALFLEDIFLNLHLPVKVDFKVTEAPPGIQGDRSQAGTKTAVLETGAAVQVPLFINAGDTVRVNTETGEYVERVEKIKV